MIRETRYYVIKLSDAEKHLDENDRNDLGRITGKIVEGRRSEGKDFLRCVCVESDWPEYEATWKLIEERVNEHDKD